MANEKRHPKPKSDRDLQKEIELEADPMLRLSEGRASPIQIGVVGLVAIMIIGLVAWVSSSNSYRRNRRCDTLERCERAPSPPHGPSRTLVRYSLVHGAFALGFELLPLRPLPLRPLNARHPVHFTAKRLVRTQICASSRSSC